jgi:hypothetical protein
MFCAMLTKYHYINNLKKGLQAGILTFYRASVSSPFNRSPWSDPEVDLGGGGRGDSYFRWGQRVGGLPWIFSERVGVPFCF